MRARLATLQASLTPDHPDVDAMKREVDSTGVRLQNARVRAAANDLELRRMNDAIARGRNRIADLLKRQTEIDKLIAVAPLVAADLAELTRDTDMVKAKVTQLISKKAEAEITADLEQKSGPSAFRALESRGRFLERIEGGAAETSVDERLVALTAPMSAAAEQYRMLLHRLRHIRSLRGEAIQGGAVVAVTSAIRGEGVSLTAANLALTAARSRDARVALVHCDLRRGGPAQLC